MLLALAYYHNGVPFTRGGSADTLSGGLHPPPGPNVCFCSYDESVESKQLNKNKHA